MISRIKRSAQKGRDQLQLCLRHKQIKVRSMPIYGTPSLNINPEKASLASARSFLRTLQEGGLHRGQECLFSISLQGQRAGEYRALKVHTPWALLGARLYRPSQGLAFIRKYPATRNEMSIPYCHTPLLWTTSELQHLDPRSESVGAASQRRGLLEEERCHL